MPIPSGLDFKDRIAPFKSLRRGRGHYIRCKRRGHKKLLKFIPGAKGDAVANLNAHDARYHNPMIQIPGVGTAVRIDELCAEWLAHIEELEVEKLRSPQTTRHYALTCDYLTRGMRSSHVVHYHEITPAKLSEYIRWMRRHSKSTGALIADSIIALKTMARWKGLSANWQIPHDDIRAVKREKKDLDVATIRRLIAAMPEGSVEEAVAYLKARTGCRDVEVLDARREEFDLDAGLFVPMLRSKRKQRRHLYVLTADVIAKLRPFVLRAGPSGAVFTDEQRRPLTRELLRPRIRAAAKRAGFLAKKKDKRKSSRGVKVYEFTIGGIDSIAQIRAEVATNLSLDDAREQLGHKDEATTLKHYIKRITPDKIAERRRVAEAIAKAIPLR